MQRVIIEGFLIVLLSISCSSRPNTSDHVFRIYEETGIQVTETTGGPKYDSELFQFEVELVIPPGKTEESVLEFPRQFYSDSNGYLYIVDEFKAAILVYHPDGQYSHTIGRKGYGPGEFQHPRVQAVRNGIVSIFDLPTRRLSLFSFDGKLIETSTAPRVSLILTMNWNTREYHILPDSTQVLIFRPQDQRTDRETERVNVLFLSSTSDTLIEIGTPWIDTGYPVESRVRLGGAYTTVTRGRPFPFGPKPTCSLNPLVGIVMGTGVDPILTVYDLNAEMKREIRIIEEPVLVDATMKEKVTEAIRERVKYSEGVIRESWQEYLEQLQFPDTIAFSADVEVEDSGYIWVKVPEYPTAVAEYVDSTWRLISPEGEYLGLTKRPEDDMRNPAGSWRKVFNGRLLIMHEDEDTGEWLPTVYRIQPIIQDLKYPD